LRASERKIIRRIYLAMYSKGRWGIGYKYELQNSVLRRKELGIGGKHLRIRKNGRRSLRIQRSTWD